VFARFQRSRRFIPSCIVFAFLGIQAWALPVKVELGWPVCAPKSTPTPVHVEAVQTAGDTNNAVPVEADTSTNSVVLNLGKGAWHVQASALGYWSQSTELVVARESPAIVQLTMWPASSLNGEITTAGGEQLPHFLEVRLNATPKSTPQEPPPLSQPRGPSHAELHCRIDAGRWSCVGPAGLFDVQLDAPGYAPRYEWAKILKSAESTDLGPTMLRRAASVFGRAVLRSDSDPPGPCRAVLQPDLERHGPDDSSSESNRAEPNLAVPLS